MEDARVEDARPGFRMPTMLPNGDIYLGPLPGGRPDNVAAPAAKDPRAINAGELALEKAVEDNTHQEGQARIECPWCGQVAEGAEAFKTHIKTLHGKQLGSAAEDIRQEEEAALDLAAKARAEREDSKP